MTVAAKPKTKIDLKLAIATLLLFCLSCYFSYQYIQTKQQTYQQHQDQLLQTTKQAADSLDQVVLQVTEAADLMVEKLTSGQVNHQHIDQMLFDTLNNNRDFYGSTVTFKPYGYDQNSKLFSRYLFVAENKFNYQQIEQQYDYTEPNNPMTAWYTKTMVSGKQWHGPYWDDAGGTFMMTYAAPFYRNSEDQAQNQPLGVVTIDMSVNHLREIILSMDLGTNGYPTLTANDTRFIYHRVPGKTQAEGPKSIVEIAQSTKHMEFYTLIRAVAEKRSGVIEGHRNHIGKSAWLIYAPVNSNGWSLQSLFVIEDIPIDANTFRQLLYQLTTAWLLFGCCLSLLFVTRLDNPVKRVSIHSGLVSLVLFAGIAALWAIDIKYPDDPDRQSDSLTSLYEVAKHVDEFQQHELKTKNQTYFVRTGLEIESMALGNGGGLSISGFIWLHYHDNGQFTLDHNSIQFAQAQSSEFITLKYHKNQQDEVYQLLQFEAIVDSNNDQSNYPLELEHVALTIIPITAEHNVHLIPDLVAYTNKIPTAKPGLNQHLSINGWDILASYFSLHHNDKNSNFGLKPDVDRVEFGQLRYNVVLKRNFIDAFISNLTPLIVVSIVLFAITLLTHQMTIAEMFGIAVSMFFVVVFSHLSIRSNLAVGEIFYLEYFYLVVYLTILIVPFNHFRISLNLSSKFLDYQNGLYFKALYWPLTLATFFVITFLQFY